MSNLIGYRASVNWEDFGAGRKENSLITILAVDDNEALRYSLVRSLREAGYKVVEARTGTEALALAAELPDLITLDVNLPDMHGFEVCKQIKSNAATAHIPVLHLSSTFVEPDARVQGLASGADAYLVEPIDRAELVATVGALLRLKRAETLARQQAGNAEAARQELAHLNATLERRVQERTVQLEKANNSLRELSVRILQMQDEERKRIARELHDGVGQLLVAIKMNNDSIASEMQTFSPAIKKALSDNDLLVEEVVKSIRTMSHLLHPPLLDEVGLPSALRWYAEEFSERSGIQVALDVSPSLGRLPGELETAIFRIVQECLGNVHRHSGSALAKIQLELRDGQLHLEVRDEGSGIAVDRQKELTTGSSGGVGVRGMQERVSQLKGKLGIESGENGTTVRAVLPCTPRT